MQGAKPISQQKRHDFCLSVRPWAFSMQLNPPTRSTYPARQYALVNLLQEAMAVDHKPSVCIAQCTNQIRCPQGSLPAFSEACTLVCWWFLHAYVHTLLCGFFVHGYLLVHHHHRRHRHRHRHHPYSHLPVCKSARINAPKNPRITESLTLSLTVRSPSLITPRDCVWPARIDTIGPQMMMRRLIFLGLWNSQHQHLTTVASLPRMRSQKI